MLKHPHGIRPLGNLLSDSVPQFLQSRRRSLGLLSQLPDAIITRILDAIITTSKARQAAITLSRFSACSTFLRAFTADEDLWRRLVFQLYAPAQIACAPFSASWRHTFITLESGSAPLPQDKYLGNAFVYSDVLFHKWLCLTCTIRPEWLIYDDVPRISAKHVTFAQFQASFEQPNIPVIVKNLVTEWPAFKTWSKHNLCRRFGSVNFNAGGFDFPLKHYFSYCEAIENHDDQPLYIFDKEFAAKAPQLAEEYQVPSYFSEDLFKVLDDKRPDYRWLIIGPTRSGSSFHKDPNATSAWNAVIKGRKKWVMFPPDIIPPGIYPSGDEGNVTAPISITEWFLNFYDRQSLKEAGGIECVVSEGELIFVPMGWWHCVLNIETSIAITQNYVGSCNVTSVVQWVQNRPAQVSGCRTLEQKRYISENFPRLVADKYPMLACKFNKTLTPNCSKPEDETDNGNRRNQSLWDSLKTSSKGSEIEDMKGQKDKSHTERKLNASFAFGF